VFCSFGRGVRVRCSCSVFVFGVRVRCSCSRRKPEQGRSSIIAADDNAAGHGVLFTSREGYTLGVGILSRVDFGELGADLLAVYRYDFRAVWERSRPVTELGECVIEGALEQR
jgi:hypothetical protein